MIVLLIQLSEKRRVLSPIWHACSTIRFLCREIIWGFPAAYPWWSNLKILFFIKFWLEPKNFFMKMGSLPIAQFRPRKNLKRLAKSETSDTRKWAQLHHVSHQFYQSETAQSILHNSNWQGTIVRGSVTKYIFAKFRRIFPKLSSKIMVGVVLIEKDWGKSSTFGLDRSDVDFSKKNFAWTKRCAHTLCRIRYIIVLWN